MAFTNEQFNARGGMEVEWNHSEALIDEEGTGLLCAPGWLPDSAPGTRHVPRQTARMHVTPSSILEARSSETVAAEE